MLHVRSRRSDGEHRRRARPVGGASHRRAPGRRELFGDKDVTAVDRWVAADYRQHSSAAPDGPEGLRGLIGSLTDDVRHEVARVIAEGDLVAVHGVYYGFGPDPMVALFRVANGKLAERWDGLTPQVTKTVSGRSQVDVPAEASDLDKTEANRALALEFAEGPQGSRLLRGDRLCLHRAVRPAPPGDR